jgi:hypothetical protein
MRATSPLHVAFGNSAASALRSALRAAGRRDAVISFDDDLSWGPIGSMTAEERGAWAALRPMPMVRPSLSIAAADRFWQRLLTKKRTPILYFSRRAVREFTGFLECMRRLGEHPFRVVDLTGDGPLRPCAGIPQSLSIYIGLSEMQPAEAARYLDCDTELATAARDQYCRTWDTLRAENAPLRVLGEEGVQSAPITYFDPDILLCVTKDWQKTAKIVGDLYRKSFEDPVFQIGVTFIVARLHALAASGAIEIIGDVQKIRFSEVRRRSETQRG